jgi:hypothetical protein
MIALRQEGKPLKTISETLAGKGHKITHERLSFTPTKVMTAIQSARQVEDCGAMPNIPRDFNWIQDIKHMKN